MVKMQLNLSKKTQRISSVVRQATLTANVKEYGNPVHSFGARTQIFSTQSRVHNTRKNKN